MVRRTRSAAGLVLRGIFLCRNGDRLVPLRHARLFPGGWRDFAGHLPEEERSDLLKAYHARLFNPARSAHAGGAQLERL